MACTVGVQEAWFQHEGRALWHSIEKPRIHLPPCVQPSQVRPNGQYWEKEYERRGDHPLRVMGVRARLSPAARDTGYSSRIWDFWDPPFCPY